MHYIHISFIYLYCENIRQSGGFIYLFFFSENLHQNIRKLDVVCSSAVQLTTFFSGEYTGLPKKDEILETSETTVRNEYCLFPYIHVNLFLPLDHLPKKTIFRANSLIQPRNRDILRVLSCRYTLVLSR